jgi:hypothetical protein
MSQFQEIRAYLDELTMSKEDLEQVNDWPLFLSRKIMEFVHRDQKRENGQDYAHHPLKCLNKYRDLVGIVLDDYAYIDKELIAKYAFPFEGVQEVCLLHDVIEDSELTVNELEELFDDYGLGDYFRLYIKDALFKITHDKSMDYLSYILKCMENPISAIAKMMDLQDNMNVLSLVKFDEKHYQRTAGYLHYMYLINDKYHFIENVAKYKKEFSKLNTLKYLTLGDERQVFVESANHTYLTYDSINQEWKDATTEVWDTQFGYDESEPEGSPYRFGNGSCMKTIRYISKADAEMMIGFKISQRKLIAIFNDILNRQV